MKKLTGKIERSEELQRKHDEVIPRLLAGESAQQLAKQFNVKAGTLRNWKVRALKRKKRIEKDLASHLVDMPETTNDFQDVVTPELQGAVTRETEVSQGDATDLDAVAVKALRSFLGDQAVTALSHIEALRPEVARGLSGLHKLILDSIEGLQAVLDSGMSPKFATFQGSVTHKDCPITASDRTNIANAIKALRYEYAALHSLPLEPLKISTLEVQTKQLAAAQHLHLHSHGSKVSPKPIGIPQVATVTADVIDVPAQPSLEPASAVGPELEDWQQELIKS